MNQVATLPPTTQTKALIVQAISQLNFVSVSLAELRRQMQQLAASLPEYPVVLAMSGVGETLGPQLIAEIGDVRRFSHKGALVAFAGVDAPRFNPVSLSPPVEAYLSVVHRLCEKHSFKS